MPVHTSRTRRWRVPAAAATWAFATVAVACGNDDDGGNGRAELPAFCAEMERLEGERPESYVGSAEHLEDMNAVVGVAPEEIRPSVETVRDYIESGLIQAGGPEANETASFPPDVQQAIAQMRNYASTNC